jgi:hypothetical protein
MTLRPTAMLGDPVRLARGPARLRRGRAPLHGRVAPLRRGQPNGQFNEQPNGQQPSDTGGGRQRLRRGERQKRADRELADLPAAVGARGDLRQVLLQHDLLLVYTVGPDGLRGRARLQPDADRPVSRLAGGPGGGRRLRGRRRRELAATVGYRPWDSGPQKLFLEPNFSIRIR